jgi:hypothetical protein
MMRLTLAVSILMALVVNELTYVLPTVTTEEKVEAQVQELRDNSTGSKWKVETHYYMVQFEDNEFFYAEAIDYIDEGDMILDKKYQLGDIVKVTTDEYGEIIHEELVTGEELDTIDEQYASEIDYLMDVGMDYIYEQEQLASNNQF